MSCLWVGILILFLSPTVLATDTKIKCLTDKLTEVSGVAKIEATQESVQVYQKLLAETPKELEAEAKGQIQFFLDRIQQLKELQAKIPPLTTLSNEALIKEVQTVLDKYHREDKVLPGLEPGNTIRGADELIALALREPLVKKLMDDLSGLELLKDKDKGFRLKVAQKILRQFDLNKNYLTEINTNTLNGMSALIKKYFEEVTASMEFDDAGNVKVVGANDIPGFGVQSPLANFLKSIANPLGNGQMIQIWSKNPIPENFAKALKFYCELKRHFDVKPILVELDRRIKGGMFK